MYNKRNFATRSCQHCCSGKAMNITYFVCVCVCVCLSVAWLSSMQSTCELLYSHLFPFRLYYIIPHYLIKVSIFGKNTDY